MSNTSLKPITIPKLNTPDFGESIMEAFKNISLNFQKLSNLGVNQGAPGRSCIYLPINLGAAFVYNPYTENDKDYAQYYNRSDEWLKKIKKELSNNDKWNAYVASVERDFRQFTNATGYDEHEYARIACLLLWDNPFLFGFDSDGDKVTAKPYSLAGTLHAKYGDVEGSARVETADGPTLYGNWLYELNLLKNTTDIIDRYFDIFYAHWDISPVGKLIVAFSPDNEYNTFQPVGSFEYWYIDPRYRCGKEVIGDSAIRDISCVLRWEANDFTPGPETRWGGSFEILEIFPSIRVGEDSKYYWFINGLNTGIPVRGEDGAAGTNGTFVVVERIENVTGWHPRNFPNGKDFASPKSGRQTIYVPTFSGIPSRVLTNYQKRLADNIQIPSIKRASKIEETFGEKKFEFELAQSATGKISQFVITEDNAWLPEHAQLENFSNIAYLHRIFRIVGREKFWKYPVNEVVVKPIDDEWDRAGDPSCDEFYFERNDVSEINPDGQIQKLISDLDGAAAIVLPGPAYQQGRTDTSFWFATLRRVEISNGVGMLVAYCSPHAQQTTQLDEHAQVSMMMGFDAYAHKNLSDNRNKPRGLVLPIGSITAATETPSDTWAAHIMHSDSGGFSGREGMDDDCRGIQWTPNRTYDSDLELSPDNRAIGTGSPLNEFSHVINKRVLHIGSVNDVRTLNYAENVTDHDSVNGGVPGRVQRNEEREGPIHPLGSSNFFGKNNAAGWFEGSELHIDEPVTITRYRDLKRKGRLLDVEGDTVIGPHQHKNMPTYRYRKNAGGLWVASTLSSETINGMLYSESIFWRNFINGSTPLSFEPFIANGLNLTSVNEAYPDLDRWQSRLGRWNGSHSIYVDDEKNDLNRDELDAGDNPLFSALFDDTIGARMVIVEDGIAIYNPAINLGERGNIRVPFSVDAAGNIQSYGREIRSNSHDTRWVFHSKWGAGHTPSKQRPDKQDKDAMFKLPKHNQMIFATDHEVQWHDSESGVDDFKQRFWRSANGMSIDVMSENATRLPIGYYGSIGFMNKDGHSATTFPFNSGNSTNWGDSDCLPTVLSLPNDLAWNWGAQMTTGIHPLPFKREFDEKNYGMRYGGTFNYGIVILNDARTPTTIPSNEEGAVTAKNYISNPLTINYKWNDFKTIPVPDGVTYKPDMAQYYTPDEFDFAEDTTGQKAKLFRDGGTSTGIGLWNMSGQVVEKSMIVGGDILGYSSALVRGQIRGRSFRRLINSENEPRALADNIQPKWAFLLDNGLSSETARQASLIGDKIIVAHESSPLYMDFGPYLGDKRLVKFGYINSSLKTDGGKLEFGEGSADTINDRQVSLVASTPWESFSVTRTGKLFKSNGNFYPITATLTSVGGVNKLDIALKLNHRIKSDDFWRKGASQRYRGVACYGVDTGRAPKHDSAVAEFADLNGEKSRAPYDTLNTKSHWGKKNSIKSAPPYQAYNKNKNVVCNGFNALNIFGDHKDCIPKTAQWFAVPSLYAGSQSCNWYVEGTNDDRSFQKGLWFMLDTDGKLYIPYWNEAGSLFNCELTINISFTWMSAGVSNTKFNLCASSRKYHNDEGIARNLPSNSTTVFKRGLNEPVWPDNNGDWAQNGTRGWLYIQYEDGGSTSDWMLFETHTKQTIEHKWYTAWDDDNDEPTEAAKKNPKPVSFDSNGNVIPSSDNSYKYLVLVNTTIEGVTNPPVNGMTVTTIVYTLLAGPDGEVESYDEGSNWTWDSVTDPTNDSLKNWLNGVKLADLTGNIIPIIAGDDSESDDAGIKTITGPYGQATIEKVTLANGKDGAKVSLWVTADSDFGKTHRSINFTVTEVNATTSKIVQVDSLNSVLLKKQITPGYYRSTKISNNKPSGDITYLGVTQTESTNGSTYIWYTPDGDTWQCVSSPSQAKSDRVYVLCTGRSNYRENYDDNDAQTYYVPSGILCYFDDEGTPRILKGKNNYVEIASNGKMKDINSDEHLRSIWAKLKSSAAPGQAELVDGFTFLMSIDSKELMKRADDGSQIVDNTKWKIENLPGLTPLWTLDKIATKNDFELARATLHGKWVNKLTGKYTGDNEVSIDSILSEKALKGGLLERYISSMFNFYIIGHMNDEGLRRKYSVYSDNTGWTGAEWSNLVMRNCNGLVQLDWRCETQTRAPEDNAGALSVPQLYASLSFKCHSTKVLVEGTVQVRFGSMEWPGHTNDYFCSYWSLGDHNWPSGLDDYKLKLLCAPYCIIDKSLLTVTDYYYAEDGYSVDKYQIRYSTKGDKIITKLN